MKVLITGGAGFVGRHMTKKLCDLNYDVTVIDNMVSESSQEPTKWMEHLKPESAFKFINKDCRVFFEQSDEVFDIVVHLAAVVGGRLTIENKPLAVAEDLAIDAMMFNWAVRTGQKKIIFLSSSAAYPIEYQTRDNYKLLSENMINFSSNLLGKPDLSYGWAKLTGEYLAKLAYERNGLKSVCFRPFSGYGEDQNVAYPYPSILQRVINAGSKNDAVIDVWGSGEQVRDFIYIDDCIDAILHISKQIDDGTAVNLGTGVPTSFVELIQKMSNVIYGKDIKINRLLEKPEGVFYRAADTTLMHSYGFKPKVTLEDGIRISFSKFRKVV